MNEKAFIGTNLIMLAYIYLLKKQRITHKQYTVGDLFWTMERILRHSEQTNRNRKACLLTFKDDLIEIDQKYL